MKKGFLLAASIVAVLSMTACGGSKEETTKESDAVQETVQQTEDDFPENGADEEEAGDVFYSAEEVCAMYYDYLTGALTEEEFEELLQTIAEGVSVERAKEIFEESGELYGFSEPVVCEPSPEILNASAGDQLLQVGDVIIQFPCTFGDFMEAVGGEFGDKDEASSSDRAMSHERKLYSLDATFQTLDTLGAHGNTLVKTSDGSFLWLYLGNGNEEILSAKDLYITKVITGSANVFFAGGFHAGLSMQEVDEILDKSKNEFQNINNKGWTSNTNYGYLYRSVGFNNQVRAHFQIDPEENQLWHMEFYFETPYYEE